MRPDGPRDTIAGPDDGPQPPFPLRLNGKVIKGFGRGSSEVSFVLSACCMLMEDDDTAAASTPFLFLHYHHISLCSIRSPGMSCQEDTGWLHGTIHVVCGHGARAKRGGDAVSRCHPVPSCWDLSNDVSVTLVPRRSRWMPPTFPEPRSTGAVPGSVLGDSKSRCQPAMLSSCCATPQRTTCFLHVS